MPTQSVAMMSTAFVCITIASTAVTAVPAWTADRCLPVELATEQVRRWLA